MHGYEIRKRLSVTLGPLAVVSFGSLYPCLRRLRKAGFVQETAPEPGTRRRRRSGERALKAKKTKRRKKKVYEITAAGERFFFDQLDAGAAYDTDRFQTRFAFFRYLPKESRISHLERRKAYLQEKLEEFKESLRSAKERIDAYTLTLTEHGMEAIEQDIRWLEQLIDRERAAGTRRN